MEPISLAVGAVALAGLFSLCVQCFDLIDVAKNLGPEGELLVVKLSIEKRRLMIWGECVGILRPDKDRDPLLDEPDTRQLVERILGNIQRLFYEADALKSKYGLDVSLLRSGDAAEQIRGSTVCSSTFESSPIVQFQSKLFDHHGKVGLRAKTKWAIRDSKKFATLVQHLKDLTDGLSNITTSTGTEVLRGQLIREETQSIPDLETLKIIEGTCSDADWRSSASLASEYLGHANKLSSTRRQEISEWVDMEMDAPPIRGDTSQAEHSDHTNVFSSASHESGETSASLPWGNSYYKNLVDTPQGMPRLQAVNSPYGGPVTEVLVLCSTSTLKAYIPDHNSRTRAKKFHVVEHIPAITAANKMTASRMMKAITVPPQVQSPSITIYCPPRMRYVHMALAILNPFADSTFNFQLRFDDRLLDEYTVFKTVNERMTGYHRDIEAFLDTHDPVARRIVDAIDVNWLEQRIDILNTPSYRPPTNRLDWHTIFRQSKDDVSCVGIIIMAGEAACWDIFNIPPVVPPDVFREGRVFRLRELDGADARSSHRWKAEHYCNVTIDKDYSFLVNSLRNA